MDGQDQESNANFWDAENLFERLWYRESVSSFNLILRLILEEVRLAEPWKVVDIVKDSAQRKLLYYADTLLYLSEKVVREFEEEELKNRCLKDGEGDNDGWITADV